MLTFKTLAAVALAACALAGCVAAEADALDDEQVIRSYAGSASWYGPGFHGRKTANGERYDMNKLTAAHKSLPFGTKVRVTNNRTGKSVVVRINDRGPYVGRRVIDLSKGAARAVGLIETGVAPVKLDILASPSVEEKPAVKAAAAEDSQLPGVKVASVDAVKPAVEVADEGADGKPLLKKKLPVNIQRAVK